MWNFLAVFGGLLCLVSYANAEQGKGFDRFLEEAKEIETHKAASVLITNVAQRKLGSGYPKGLRKTIVKEEASTVWDIVIPAYSKTYAEYKGYSDDFVLDMPKGVLEVEYRQLTIGSELSCTLAMRYENQLKIDVPWQQYSNFSHANNTMHMGDIVGKVQWGRDAELYGVPKEIEVQWEGELHAYFIEPTSPSYGKYALRHLPLMFSKKNGGAYNYLILQIDCNKFRKKPFNTEIAELWLRKEDSPAYTNENAMNKEHYVRLKLPKIFLDTMYHYVSL